VPQFSEVVVVVEENHSYSEVIGNASMPYLNSLASQYGLATQFYADAHPSIPNYFVLSTGQPITFNDSFNQTVSADNVVRELLARGKTWKCYAEGLPNAGYLGGDVYPYMQHHNPFVFFSDVVNNPAQASNIVPFGQFGTDLAAGSLPSYSFVVPNNVDNAHDAPLSTADAWLQQNIAPLVSSPQFQQGGLLIITFDEGALTDLSDGGGHIPVVIVSAKAKKGFKSSTTYEHQSVLRLSLEALGVSKFPGTAAVAPDMGEVF
jgi:acid phosphatase